MHRTFIQRTLVAAALALALTAAVPSSAKAQVILTPFAGATFNGDAPNSQLSTGLSLLFMGAVAGLELEAGITPDFFAESDSITFSGDSNVTSLMANLVIGVGAGPVRPYVAGGIGLLRSRVDEDDFFDGVSSDDWGFNVGGGVMFFFNDHVGIRGDARYFRTASEIDAGEIQVSLGDFDYWRAYGGLSLKF